MESSSHDIAAPAGERASFLTVEEAATVLRIGRTAAYEATRRYRATAGAEGIPVYKVGGTLRVPRYKLEEIAGGAIDVPIEPTDIGAAREPSTANDRPAPVPPIGRASDGDAPVQPALPFTA